MGVRRVVAARHIVGDVVRHVDGNVVGDVVREIDVIPANANDGQHKLEDKHRATQQGTQEKQCIHGVNPL